MPSLLDTLRTIGQETAKSVPKVGLATGLAGLRLGVDGLQGLSGLYDLVTPGKGTNRFTGKLDSYAKNIDSTAVNNDVNPAYRIMQAALTPASFYGPGALIKSAGFAPKVATTIPKISDIAGSLAKGNAAQKIVSAGLQGAQPVNAINAAYGTATDLGRMTAQGQDINPVNGGLTAALNAATPLAIPAAGQAAIEGIRVTPDVAQAATKAGSKALNVKPYRNISDDEISALRKFQNVRQGQGDAMQLSERDALLYKNFLAKTGISPTNVNAQLQILNDRIKYDNTKIRRSGNVNATIQSIKSVGAR